MITTHVQISNRCSQMVEESTNKEQLFNHLLTIGSAKCTPQKDNVILNWKHSVCNGFVQKYDKIATPTYDLCVQHEELYFSTNQTNYHFGSAPI